MEIQIHKRLRLVLVLAVMLAVLPASARPKKEKADSLVRLMKADRIEQLMLRGQQYRKAISSTFLHNGTYLISDSAMWNVDTKVINAYGNVKVIQDETILTSDNLEYLIDENLAKFRGAVVQLQNKKQNTLRTRYLDYNTKDSMAVFSYGGSMRDKDGQVIESLSGTYNSGSKHFVFEDQVNMFSDSMFVKTYMINYDSDRDLAEFPSHIDFWKDGKMLSGENGWFSNRSETLFLTNKVHGLSDRQEFWSDSLYYYRGSGNIELYGNAQLQDTSRHVTAVADRVHYIDTLSQVELRRNAAVALETKKEGQRDTIYMGADTLIYRSIRRCDIPESTVKGCESRLADILTDPVTEYRQKAAEAAAKAKEEASRPQGRTVGGKRADKSKDADKSKGEKKKKSPKKSGPEQLDDTLAAIDSLAGSKGPADSLSLVPGADSLKAVTDSLALADSLAKVKPDTTGVGFIYGRSNVRIFRKDIQMRCDYMCYCDLDSIARFYEDPVVWNEGKRQYTADSLFVLVGGGGPRKASLQSNAFVTIREDAVSYDQIKGAEIMAYFDSLDSSLKRFDALGGSSAIFYLYENDAFATVNKVETKMLSGLMVDGNLEQVYYFEQPKNNAYPVVQLPESERTMKGFSWRYDECPKSPEDVTLIVVRPTEREEYEMKLKPRFKHTETYFPGYIKGIMAEIDARKEEAARRKAAKAEPEPELVAEDTLKLPEGKPLKPGRQKDTLGKKDSLALKDTVNLKDTLALKDTLSPKDSLSQKDTLAAKAAAADSLAGGKNKKKEEVDPLSVPTVDPKQKRKEERELRRKLRQAERDARIAAKEARWAELDRLDSLKLEAKKQKELEKKREKTRRALLKIQKQEARDQAKLQKYIEIYKKQYEREQKRKASRKRTQTPERGGEVQADPKPGEQTDGGDSILGESGSVDDDPVLSRRSLPRPEGRPGL